MTCQIVTEMAPKTTAAQAWLDASSSDDDEPADQSPEAQERRQRALQLLAKAFNKPGDKPKSVADAEDEETRFLNSLLTTPPDEMARCVRDRLSVLSVTKGGVQVSATKKPASAKSTAAAAAPAPAAEPAAARLPDLLKRLSDGDVSAVSARIIDPSYWADLVRASLGDDAALLVAPTAPPSDALKSPATGAFDAAGELNVPSGELEAMRASIDARGYGALQPSADGWDWRDDLSPMLSLLRAAATALREAGWPPAFVFTLPGAWRIVDQLFVPMQALLGDGCEMDPSVFCWIAAQPPPLHASATASAAATAAPASTASVPASAAESGQSAPAPPKAGANFGVPHRDFTCLASLRKSDGAPTLLSVWLPLNRVTTENGCMMVVPKQLDPHFHKRFAYAHMRPALPPEADEGVDGATEIRFNLAAARPLAPLPRGSVVAWVGNLIHWGTCCLPDSDAPARTSVGFNFLRAGERLQSGAPSLTRADAAALELPARLALIARSLLAYSPWYQLSDDAVPAAFFPRVADGAEAGEATVAVA